MTNQRKIAREIPNYVSSVVLLFLVNQIRCATWAERNYLKVRIDVISLKGSPIFL
jgi:hypothetical protein